MLGQFLANFGTLAREILERHTHPEERPGREGNNQQVTLRLLGIYHRQITVQRTSISLQYRALKNYPVAPKTLGEYLRQKRVDLGLSQRKLAEILAIGITDTAVEKWEKNQNRPTESHRRRIIEFLGFDPATAILTGGS